MIVFESAKVNQLVGRRKRLEKFFFNRLTQSICMQLQHKNTQSIL